MGKRSRDRNRQATTGTEVGPRQPCPCGSGRRYKACHGSASGAPTVSYVARPFAGLAAECDLVALREFVPAGTAPVTVRGHEDRTVMLCSLLPGAAPALVRAGRRGVARPAGAARVRRRQPRPRRRPAGRRSTASRARRSDVTDDPGAGPRLQDLLVDEPLDGDRARGLRLLAGRRARTRTARWPRRSTRPTARSSPTARLTSVEGAYWSDVDHQGVPALGDAARRGPAARRAGPAARGRPRPAGAGLPAGRHVPGPRAAGPGLGPRRPAPGRRRSRSRPPAFAAALDEALAVTTYP